MKRLLRWLNTPNKPGVTAQGTKNVINPLHPTGGWALPHVVVLVLVAAIAFGLGWIGGSVTTHRYDATYYAKHNAAGLSVPPSIAVPVVGASAPLPSHGSVHRALFPSPSNQSLLQACTAFAFGKMASYVVNWNRQHYVATWSPRFYYELVAQGANIPTSISSYVPDESRFGSVRNRIYHYPPYVVSLPNLSLPHTVLPLWQQWLFTNPGPGLGGVTLIEQQLASHHAVGVGIDLLQAPGYAAGVNNLDVAGTTGYLDLSGSQNLGGHMMTAVRYNSQLAHNGVRGWVLFSNQWGPYFGVGWDGTRHSGPNNGYVWISYRFLARWALFADVLHYGVERTGAGSGPPYVPSHQPTVPPPVHISRLLFPTGGAASYQVKNVITADTHVDISRAINQAAARYGFSAVGYAALIGTESGIRQYAPHYPIAGAGPCDISAGLTQITVCSAAGLGIGDGSERSANIGNVFAYEQGDPNRDVWFSARLLGQFRSLSCVDFEFLYAVWNQGPGYGCGAYEYYHPGGIAAQNYLNFDGWWKYAWARYAYSPPKVLPFPRRAYGSRFSPYLKGTHRLTWAASIWLAHEHRLGWHDGPDSWHPGRPGYDKYTFSKAVVYAWPKTHRYRVAT